MKKTITLILLLGFFIPVFGQNVAGVEKQKIGLFKRIFKSGRKKVKQNFTPFDINYFYNSNNRHFRLNFELQDSVSLVPLNASIAVGNLPHKPNMGGPQVIYFDQNDNELGRYFITDPTLYRSCDTSRIGILARPPGIVFSIQLPYNTQISRVEFVGTRISPQQAISFDVGALLEDAQ